MKLQLLLSLTLTSLITVISGIPTSTSITLKLESNTLAKRSTLYCHSGLPADVCENQYGASCDDYGEIFTPKYPDDGESCTSRSCWCSWWKE